MLADVALAEELLGERRDTPPGFAPMHLAIAAFVHDARGDRGTAGRYLQLVRWLEKPKNGSIPFCPCGKRGCSLDEVRTRTRALLERPALAEDRRGETRCSRRGAR